MDAFLSFFTQHFHILLIPVIIIGLFKWSYLEAPFKIMVALISISGTIGFVSSFLKHNFLFTLNALAGVIFYILFFLRLFKGRYRPLIYIWGGVVMLLTIISVSRYGISAFKLHVFIPYDLFIIFFCILYIHGQFGTQQTHNQKLILLLVIYLLVDFLFNLGLDLITNFLKSYLSNNFMDLLWDSVVPVYNILSIIVLGILLIYVKRPKPLLSQMPDLET